MRRFAALLAAAAVARVGLRRWMDEANIGRLARRNGWSHEQARRVYWLSREVGYGAAWNIVFGGDAKRADRSSGAGDTAAAEET